MYVSQEDKQIWGLVQKRRGGLISVNLKEAKGGARSEENFGMSASVQANYLDTCDVAEGNNR